MGFIKEIAGDHVLLDVEDWSGVKTVKITRDDLTRYFNTEYCSNHTVRRLGNTLGDWRPMDALALALVEIMEGVSKN